MDFKYFDMKYVYNEWHAGLKDELCFYEDNIDDLINAVENEELRLRDYIFESDEKPFPFAHNIKGGPYNNKEQMANFKYAYHDPNLECKIAFNKDQQLQYNLDGAWYDLPLDDKPNWESDYEWRVKPEEDEEEKEFTDEDFDNLYNDILKNGFVNEKYKQKFLKLMNAYKENVEDLVDYAELDVSEWGIPIY